jgi:hypothetical protein
MNCCNRLPGLGSAKTFDGYFLPLIVAAALAVFGCAVFRCLPLWYLTAILPACFLAYSTQPYRGLPTTCISFPSALMFSVFQLPALLICWWWDQRKTWT